MAITKSVELDCNPTIAELVKIALRSWGNPRLRRLSCESCEQQDSTIILSGQLDSFYHSQVAQSIAAKVPGVGRVINQVQVCS